MCSRAFILIIHNHEQVEKSKEIYQIYLKEKISDKTGFFSHLEFIAIITREASRMANHSNDAILEQTRYEIFRHLLPVIICMIVFGIAGIFGNVLTIIFYAFKTKRATTVVLIACLAVVDLTVCVLFIPNIVEMWINVRYTQSFMCKLAHFIGLWVIACSGLILWIVAIDRHRKICFPFGKQLTLTTAKYGVIAIVVFGFFLSVRNFANFDTVEVDVKVTGMNETVKGRYCTTRDDSDYIASVTVFTVIDFLLMVMVWSTLVIAYSHIIFTLFRLKRARKQSRRNRQVKEMEVSRPNPSFETELSEATNDSHEAHSFENEHGKDHFEESAPVPEEDTHFPDLGKSEKISIIKDHINPELLSQSSKPTGKKQHEHLSVTFVLEEGKGIREEKAGQRADVPEIGDSHTSNEYSEELSSCGTLPPDSSFSQGKSSRQKKRRKYNSAKSARERNLTFKMLSVSMVFIFCFTPYFVVKIWMREVLKSGEEYELSLWSQIALRLPYMNSVFNPVVYCVFNTQFRHYIKNLFVDFVSKCFCKTKYFMKS